MITWAYRWFGIILFIISFRSMWTNLGLPLVALVWGLYLLAEPYVVLRLSTLIPARKPVVVTKPTVLRLFVALWVGLSVPCLLGLFVAPGNAVFAFVVLGFVIDLAQYVALGFWTPAPLIKRG